MPMQRMAVGPGVLSDENVFRRRFGTEPEAVLREAGLDVSQGQSIRVTIARSGRTFLLSWQRIMPPAPPGFETRSKPAAADRAGTAQCQSRKMRSHKPYV